MPQNESFPKICVALGAHTPEHLFDHAQHEIEQGDSFLEFRLDFLDHPHQGIDVLKKTLARYPEASILATCRRHQNHGRFNGSVEEQLHLLEQAIEGGAMAVDVEIETAEVASDHVGRLRNHCKLVVSYHNFETTPNMDQVLRRMTRIPADAYKIVTTARKQSDNSRVLALARSNPRVPMVVLAMGEVGFPTRVLSTAFSGLYTYAAPLRAEGTAAGQVTARVLRHTYRLEKLCKTAKLYGVIADPVRHSISPVVHNRAFQAKRIDAVYLPLLVHAAQLKDFMIAANQFPLAGFSVTLPHKQKIIRYLDVVDPLSRRIGAVNTVWKRGGKWRGTNTDAAAVTGPLYKMMKPAHARVLVVGNGGAARSAACALIAAGSQVAITGRNPDRIRALAKMCDAEPVLREKLADHHFDALVHATPLGMFPHNDTCFFDGSIPADIVFDMVYNPLETVLIRRASEQKKTVINGLEMFIEQASKQFEIWTGESAPVAAMRKAALETLLAK